MKESIKYIKKKAERRSTRVRVKFCGTLKKPRMSVHLSNQHIYVQLIDDQSGKTILAFADSILEKGQSRHVSLDLARTFGKKVAEGALAKGIEAIVFDRGSRTYHGRVKAFAEAAREGGLKF